MLAINTAHCHSYLSAYGGNAFVRNPELGLSSKIQLTECGYHKVRVGYNKHGQ